MSTGYGNSTTGLGVAAQVALLAPLNNPPGSGQTKPGGDQVLSLSSLSPDFASFQIDCEIQDAAGNPLTGTAFTLTSVAASSGTSPADAVYTGTITGGDSNAFAGFVAVVTGFVASSGVNNGTFDIVASSATTLTLTNAAAVNETHAGTATLDTSEALEYNILYGGAQDGNVVSVTTDGFVQALNVGHACVEVSYPTFGNTLGNTPNSFTWPLEKIYREINFKVVY